MLVAHDRWFLEAVGTAVLELEGGRSRYFKGTWHAWRKEKAARELALGRAIEKQEAEIARARALRHPLPRRHARAPGAVARRRSSTRWTGSRATRATARRSASPSSRPSARAAWSSRSRTASCGSASASCCDDFELWLERGEHVTLVGAERHGQDDADLDARGRARARRGQAAPRPQPQGRAALAARRGARLDRHRARGVPARDGAQAERGARAARPVPVQRRGGREAASTGSRGGERRRLSLAVLVQSGANVLILDEPTNHLDLESREALESALQVFPGALLLISHDRALLDAVGTRTIAIEDQTLHSYVGGWPEYVRVREERAELEREAKRAKPLRRAEAQAARAGGAEADARRRRRRRASSRPRSRRPRPSSPGSRRSWPTRPPGTTRARRRSRRASTPRRRRASSSSTSSSRPSPAAATFAQPP